MKNPQRLSTGLCLLALILCAAAPASAQGGGGQGGGGGQAGASAALARATNDWQRSFDAARQGNNTEAIALLTRAKVLLNQADAARAHGEYGRSTTSTQAATALILRANQLLRSGPAQAGNFHGVEQALRETESILSNVRGAGIPPEQVRHIRALVDRARHARAEGKRNTAERLAVMAHAQGRRAWQQSATNRQLVRRCDVLETNVQPLVQRAIRAAQASANETMKAAAGRADEHLRMARSLDSETQPAVKARLLENALREAESVLRILDATAFSAHQASRVVGDAEAAMNRAEEVLREAGDTASPEMVTRGRDRLREANQALAAGDNQRAELLAEEARKQAQIVLRNALGNVNEESVRQAISQTDLLIGRAVSQNRASSADLVADARERQGEARRFLADGEFRRALAQTRIAARLAQRAYELR